MKKIFYTSKSRLLLLTLFALITGVSPAWAQTTEEFSGDTWPDGWSLGGSATATDFYLETDNDLYNTPTPKRGVYGQVSSGTTKYIITPVVNGNGSFQFKRRNSSNGSVYVYTIADDGTLSATAITSNSSKPTSWTSVSFSNVENKKLAIVLNGRMDKFIYTPGTDVSAGIGVYSDSEATTAVKNGVNLNWGLVETAQSQTYYIKNESGADWNNLAVSHSGNATVSSVSSSLADDAVIALNIGMAASGSTNDEITITAGEDLTFTISISGSVKDAEKIFIDFEDNAMPESWSFDSGWTATSGYANIGYTGAYIRSGYISVDEGGEDLLFDYQGNYSWGGSYSDIKVYWARTGNGSDADWTEVSATYSITYNEWKTASVRIPANARYIAIYGKYVNIDNIYGLKVNNAEPEAIGVMSFSQSDYAFGLVSENVTSSAFTISNNGTGAVNGLSVVSNSDYFEVAVADNATSIAAGETATFTVTIKPGSAVGKLSGTITVSATDQESVSFGVSGYVLPAGTTSENFDDQAVPTNWSSTGTWKTGNESEIGATSAATMTTPNVTVKDGDFLAIKVRNYGSYSDDYVQVEGYDGSSWSVIKKIMSTEFYSSSSSTTLIVDVPTTAKQLRFTAYYAYIDEIAGLRYAPVLTVKQGDATVTTPAAYAFGEIGATQKVTYSLANTGAGAGTINITNVVSSNDVFTTNWTESTAAPFDLVITANYNAEKAGEQNGAITVTTTEGEFVINLTSTFLAANAPKFAVVMNET
ncbi:MAG: DUF1573 domain-containing protein, partial [Prevotella sp.]|nr:DUF1573 domain-containing protein [Prevotella sp.]